MGCFEPVPEGIPGEHASSQDVCIVYTSVDIVNNYQNISKLLK